jgi:hypothetical protein
MLQRAILMPEDVNVDQNEKRYPDPGCNLMKNPMPGMKLSKRFHQRKRELKNNMNNSHYY